jgi:hypothetical protein
MTDLSHVSESGRRGPKPPRSRRRRILFWTAYPLYIALLVFGGAKLYWLLQYGVPPSRSLTGDDIWRRYYRELWDSGVYNAEIGPNDGHFDVLLLGGSVLEQVANRLEDELRGELGDRVRVWKLAKSAHTSRDSFHKFSKLRDKSFDLIVIYHGINDTRMNCCPEADFRDDYSHCQWYASFAGRLAGTAPRPPFTALTFRGKIPLGEQSEAVLDYGRTIKTGPAFRKNLETIVAAAHTARTPVVLMSFAWHIPEDYSRDRFERGALDYGDGEHRLPVELWGRPDAVGATIEVHNAAVRALATRYDNVLFIDQRELLPRDGRYFSDVCHLTADGCAAFVDNFMAAVRPHLVTRPTPGYK